MQEGGKIRIFPKRGREDYFLSGLRRRLRRTSTAGGEDHQKKHKGKKVEFSFHKQLHKKDLYIYGASLRGALVKMKKNERFLKVFFDLRLHVYTYATYGVDLFLRHYI